MSSENLPIVSGSNGDTLQIAEATRPTPEFEQQQSHSGMNLYDILFMLFRHKWKIILFALGGLLAAAGVYIFVPPIYESEAKLFVRYVLDKSAVDLADPQIKPPNPFADRADSLIGSEAEILNSRDLAQQVAEAVGIDKILPKAGAKASLEKATETLSRGLDVSTVKGTNIIQLSFRSTDPKLPMPILQEWVKRYFDKHLEVHRSMGTFDFVAKETEQLRLQLHQTEEELKRLKEKAGVVSLKESSVALATELGKAQEELDSAEAEAAAQQARVEALEKSLMLVDKEKPSATPQPVSPGVIQKYQSLATQLTQLQQSETDLLSRYTAENRLVKIKSAQIAAIQKQRQDLEKKYPALAAVVASAAGTEPAKPDIVSERARLVGLQSKVQTLRARVSELQARARVMEESGPRIEQLEREKDLEETSYKHSQESLEKARIDETLDPSRMPNISVVQTPSPVVQVGRDLKKIIMALAGGGLAAGLAIALLIESVLDRSVKRSRELENRLQIPVLLSIPYLGLGGQQLRL